MRNIIIFFFLASCRILAAQPITNFGALPSAAQLKWHDMEYYIFIHFGPNTFTNKEWGKGDEDPHVFNPTALDCRQWAATARLAGMKGIIITAKHHDGFCLWPSKFSTHTIRESGWKNGEGDILKELSQACREEGIKFGVYLSPWDRNHPDYGTDRYNQTFVNMLTEVLGNYGEVFEQWFDGANGEGPNGRKQVYDWNLFNSTVGNLQPRAIIFSDGGPGCRWVGNENGFAGTTNWGTLNVEKVYPGYPNAAELTTGHEDGSDWVPAECDVSIRPGWFYSPETDGKVKSLQALNEIYFASVGRGGNLLLNVPVDRRGLIAKEDSLKLMEFRNSITKLYNNNLAQHAKVKAVARKGFPATNLIDRNTLTVWSPPDGSKNVAITFQFDKAVKFNTIVLEEDIATGQRIKSFSIATNSKGSKVVYGTTVGHKRIIALGDSDASRVTITILNSKAACVIREIGIYNNVN